MLTLWEPYKEFDTREEALEYARELSNVGVASLLEEVE